MERAKGLVLVVDDDPAVGMVLEAILAQAGLTAQHVESGEKALERLKERPFDLVVSDVRMPGMDGLSLLAQVGERSPETPVILMTAHGSVPLAVEAMRSGAADFVLKPFDREEILFAVRKAMARLALAADAPTPTPGASWVARSKAMDEVEVLLRKAASGIATVLIRGESGTGKELAARSLHQMSPRREGPFRWACISSNRCAGARVWATPTGWTKSCCIVAVQVETRASAALQHEPAIPAKMQGFTITATPPDALSNP